MIERVEAEIAERGAVATVLGPLRGTPYKIYAALSGEKEKGWQGSWLSPSSPVYPASCCSPWLPPASPPSSRRWSLRRKRLLHAALWSAFYGAYFALMPN